MNPRIAFHIGYHKTASTWFQREAIPRHPGVRMLFHGEPWRDPLIRQLVLTPRHAFDVGEARRLLERRLAELEVPKGGVAIGSEERLSGHAATGGFDTFEIADRIHAVAPDAQVFAVVREQVDMIESEYLQLLQEGGLADLDSLLDFQPTLSSMPGFDLGHYEYDRLADRYMELLGRDRVRLFEFRAFTSDPAGFLDRVADFLDITPWPELPDDVLHRRVNPTIPTQLLRLRRTMNHFERRPLNPHPLVNLGSRWRGPLWWAASRLPKRRRSLISAPRRTELRHRYSEPNARLAERHGITFSSA